MRRLEAVIFDMDGLMIDSEPAQLVATNAALAPTGVQITEAQWRGMIGRRGFDNLTELKARHGFIEEVVDLLRAKTLLYQEAIKLKVVPMPGLYRAIELCKREGVRIAVASSSTVEDINIVIHNLGLDGEFDMLVSGEHVSRGKPAPDIFLETARVLGVEPARCAVLEDTSHGIIAASEAGMVSIAVPNDFTEGQDFSRASLVLRSLDELDLAQVETLVAD